jgi:hypothetical protein
MEQKSNKKMVLLSVQVLFLILVSINAYSQKDNYDYVSVNEVLVGSFKYGYNIQQCKKIFGEPISYKKYKDPYPVEGYGTNFYLTYDSLKYTYSEYYNEIVLLNLSVDGRKYEINIGEVTVRIGDSADKLSCFKKSNMTYLKSISMEKEQEDNSFYINMLIKKATYTSYGLITFKIMNNKIKHIYFRFDEST